MAIDDKVAFVMVKLGHLSFEKDRDQYLRSLIELCGQAVDAERVTVYVVDHPKGELWSRVAQRHPQEIRLPLGQGIAGLVGKSGETINVPDAYADPRFDRETDKHSGFRTLNTLVVPVWSTDGKRVVGVIQVLNKRDGSFERGDQMLLERIAGNVAPVLEQLTAATA
ncbi:MAG: GAF domain-containing protein [Chloroflexi bacterium]|nr:GAF domain-containing protein [Chloroflexota bacterium]